MTAIPCFILPVRGGGKRWWQELSTANPISTVLFFRDENLLQFRYQRRAQFIQACKSLGCGRSVYGLDLQVGLLGFRYQLGIAQRLDESLLENLQAFRRSARGN